MSLHMSYNCIFSSNTFCNVWVQACS